LVRIHSECLTGDALGSLRCDCGFQLDQALERIAADPAGGAVVYLKNHEGRGIGLFNKIEAYALQDEGRDTFDANVELGFQPDARNYWDAVKILTAADMTRIRLITHNPVKAKELSEFGIRVDERVQLDARVTPENRRYLQTKRDRFSHDLGNV
jgi:3,4-dihydroxy 2-butanone 4-phosphate synthase/GTP cyclohydrolase II